MPAARATASAGAGRPTSIRTGGQAVATSSAATRTGISAAPAAGPATSTASARPAGAIVTGRPTLGGEFSTSPFGGESFGGMPGLSRGRATASAGHPLSFEHLALGATPGAFGDDPFGDAPFGGDGSSLGRATANATAPAGRPTSIARYNVAAARAIAARGTPLDVTDLLDEASGEADRVPTFGLRADWDSSNYAHPLSELTPVVTEFTVERELTDLDDAIGLVQGTAATKMTATLAGTWQPDGPIPPQVVPTASYTLMPEGSEPGFDSTEYHTLNFTFGLEFSVLPGDPGAFTQIDGIRYWRGFPPGATTSPVVATQGGIWDVATATEVSGTHVTVPAPANAWGWEYVPLAAPFFPEIGRRYKVALFYTTYGEHYDYFSPGQMGGVALDSGVLRRYAALDATGGFQSSWHFGSYAYPETGDSRGKVVGVDVVASTWVTLTGNPDVIETDPVKALAPYRPDADLAGRSIVGRDLSLATGMQTRQGPITLQRFTGTVSGFSPSSASRQVTLEGTDPIDRLRNPIYQRAWGQDARQIAAGGNLGERHRRLINSQWFVDRALRTGGFCASPPPGSLSNLLLSATFHGSPLVEFNAGYNLAGPSNLVDNTYAPDYIIGDHPYGMMYPNPVQWHGDTFLSATEMPVTAGHGYAFSMLLRTVPAPADGPFPLLDIAPCFRRSLLPLIELTIDHGAPRMLVYGGNGVTFASYTMPSWTNPASPKWIFLGGHVRFTGTQVVITLYRGDTQQTFTSTQAMTDAQAMGTATLDPHAFISTSLGFAITNLSVWATPTAPVSWTGDGWIANAKIDPGANYFTGAPDIRGTEAYDLIKEINDAELGGFFFDEDGVPVWRTRALPHAPANVEEVTAQRSLVDLVTQVNEATVRNEITFECNFTEAQPPEPIFEAKNPGELDIDAGQVRRLDIELPQDCAYPFGFGSGEYLGNRLATFEWEGRQQEWWEFATEVNYCVVNRTNPAVDLAVDPALLPMNFQQTGPFSIRLFIFNNTGVPISFCTNNVDSLPQPAFQVPGRLVKPSFVVPGSTRLTGSQAKYGVRTYSLPQGRWRQYVPADTAIANSVMAWTGYPRPVLAQIDVPHNPRRKLYDQVTVTDPEGLGSVTGKLAGITTHYTSSDGARDELLVRPSHPPPGW